MDRTLIFMSQNDLNHMGNFSRGQLHPFQLKHTSDWDKGSHFHNLVNEDRQVREKLFYKNFIWRWNDMISHS